MVQAATGIKCTPADSPDVRKRTQAARSFGDPRSSARFRNHRSSSFLLQTPDSTTTLATPDGSPRNSGAGYQRAKPRSGLPAKHGVSGVT